MKNFRCHVQQERVVDVDPHRASTSSVRPDEQPTSPAKDVLPERDPIYNSFTLQTRLQTSEDDGGVQSSGLLGLWKRIGLTGHPIAVVKVAIPSKVHDNKNIMQ